MVVHEDVQVDDLQYGNGMVEVIGITVKIKVFGVEEEFTEPRDEVEVSD